MRSNRSVVALSGVLLVIVPSIWAFGCGTFYRDCIDVQDEDSLKVCQAFSMADAGGGGGGGGINPACEGEPNAENVTEECGVFVRADATGSAEEGTREKPYKTLQKAMDAAKGKRVYACASAPYAEAVTIASAVEVYGGFDCSAKDWSWSADKMSALNGPADAIALKVTSAAKDVKVENFAISAASATMAGGSSTGVLIDGGKAELTRCDVTAGDGMAGAAGVHLADDPNLNGDPGSDGVGVCAAGANNPGPVGKTKSCPSGEPSIAGSGGDGGPILGMTVLEAGTGGDGMPKDGTQPTKGKGGVGEGQPGALTCEDGISGVSGPAGDSGAGATGLGSLTSSGYAGVKGSGGEAGMPGQGGGGGGGSKGGLSINCGMGSQDRAGASGGSGGTGGCGGAGGGGGEAGGSSIALVSLKAMVTLTDVKLTVGKGGDGGKGGEGQSGGQPGGGGAFGAGAGVAKKSCGGGDGGSGGLGGPGGGGLGGHSLGIAYVGTAPKGGIATIGPTNHGKGGLGGSGNTTVNGGQGADGIAAAMQEFK